MINAVNEERRSRLATTIITLPLQTDSREVLELGFSGDGILVAVLRRTVPNPPGMEGHSTLPRVESIGVFSAPELTEALQAQAERIRDRSGL